MLYVTRANPITDGRMAVPRCFSQRMRERRESLGWSQTTLGKKVGLTQGAISLIEGGGTDSSDKILAIARVLDIDPPNFLAHADETRWLELGQALRRSDPDRLRELMGVIEALVKVPRDGSGGGSGA